MLHELAVVMPVYNEEECIVGVIRSWREHLNAQGIDHILLIYNDGSKDRTAEVLQQFNTDSRVRVTNKPNSGHGPTILTGYEEAVQLAPWVFQCDSDDELRAEDFPKLWTAREQYDALFGVRTDRQQAWNRRLISGCSRTTVRWLFGGGVRDVNVPFRLIRAPLLTEIIQKIPPDTFAPNIIIAGAVARRPVRIANIPVRNHPRCTGQPSIADWRLWKYAFRSFRQTLTCRP